MQKVTIYTTNQCPYCVRAKALLDREHIAYEEINVENQEAREQMMQKANNRRSVPQIFIGDFHVGGCDDLHELAKSGKLAEKVKQ